MSRSGETLKDMMIPPRAGAAIMRLMIELRWVSIDKHRSAGTNSQWYHGQLCVNVLTLLHISTWWCLIVNVHMKSVMSGLKSLLVTGTVAWKAFMLSWACRCVMDHVNDVGLIAWMMCHVLNQSLPRTGRCRRKNPLAAWARLRYVKTRELCPGSMLAQCASDVTCIPSQNAKLHATPKQHEKVNGFCADAQGEHKTSMISMQPPWKESHNKTINTIDWEYGSSMWVWWTLLPYSMNHAQHDMNDWNEWAI